MNDKYQIISNLQPLNIYHIKNDINYSYDSIIKVYELLNKNSEITINKLTSFLKKNNKSDIFTLIINLIEYPLLIKWVYELNVMRYYWNDTIIINLINLNKYTLKIHYFNKNYELGYKNLINLNNQYNIYYNYIDYLLIKKYNFLKNILSINLKKIFKFIDDNFFENIVFGSDFVYLIGHKDIKTIIKENISITLYVTNSISFHKETEYKYKYPYYYVQIDNITIRIYEFRYDINDIILYGYDDAIFISCNKKILCNAKFYQQLENIYIQYEKYENLKNLKGYALKIKENNIISSSNFQKCYICKKYYNNNIYIESYEYLCIECANENYINKNLKVNLLNNTFLVTGGRVKLGYSVTLKLLRFGANVIITTRYPNFAMNNYQSESDYHLWKDRLNIIECDFTKLNQIHTMLDLLQEYNFNGIINNAFQTIKASSLYYEKVNEIETNLKENIILNNNKITNIELNQQNQIIRHNSNQYILNNTIYNTQILKYNNIKINKFKDIQDEIHDNSWNKKIDEISPEEILECTLINQIVPTLIINKLKNNLTGTKFIINVTSFEGSFNYEKTDKHIHTNMCKTAMNMMIRTLHQDSDKNLHVYAINPGYVSGICPQKDKFPISLEDGATRIIYPIIKYYLNEPLDKDIMLMNNYKKYDW